MNDLDGSRLGLLSAIFDATRPPGRGGMNPVEFLGTGQCLKDKEARTWLYERRYVHEFDHIHVYEGDRCLVLPDMDSLDNGEAMWVDESSIRARGDIMDVLRQMFWDYTDSSEAAS